ncbi:MAG: polyphosphate kinase [SAR86 cluster bacterium]|jgi:polyphosphate kinase 2|nr:polyphosphate kinase [SAR86 cluster bacterium]
MQIYDVTEYSKLSPSAYKKEVERLQIELLKLQNWAIEHNKKLAIVFEGRDASGKTGIINLMKRHLIPKHINYVNIGIPDQKKSKYWFDTYRKEMPKKGEITFFDRSWYSRATVEITMGYCNKKQYTSFMRRVNNWEEDLLNEGIELRKIYLSVSKKEQQTRFKKRLKDPLRYWKLTDHDLSMAKKWDIYSFFKTQMLDRTSTQNHPWVVINANNKMLARLSSLRFVLNEFNYPDKNLEVADDWTSKITNYSYDFKGVTFENLSHQQFELLTKNLRE